MKKLLPFTVLLFHLSACTTAIKNDSNAPSDELIAKKEVSVLKPIIAPGNENIHITKEEDIVGFWVGMFVPDTAYADAVVANDFFWDYSNKINISIDEIKNGKIKGHSIVAGNERPFEGTVVYEDGIFKINLNEPGDAKYDGTFSFQIVLSNSVATGTWNAFNKIKIPKRIYELNKRMFAYDPKQQLDMARYRYIDWNKKNKIITNEVRGEEGDYDESYFTTTYDIDKYNASSQKLTTEQVANMKKGDLFILRNSIYARHGYSFKNQQLRAYFDQQPWYIPASTNVKAYLTEIEKQNIALLLRYEKNAKEYYDVFGRG